MNVLAHIDSVARPLPALVAREVRDHAALCGGCVGAALLLAAMGRWWLGAPTSPTEPAHVMGVAALALSAALPIAAEAFAFDWQSGIARVLQSAPARAFSSTLAKLALVALFVAVTFGGLLAVEALRHEPLPSPVDANRRSWGDLGGLTQWLLWVAVSAVGVTMAAAIVVRHALAAAAIGIAATLGAFGLFGLIGAHGSALFVPHRLAVIGYVIVMSAPLFVVPVGAFAAACIAHRLRGRCTQRVLARASMVLGSLLVVPTGLTLTLGLVKIGAKELLDYTFAYGPEYDDPDATIEGVVHAPDGRRLALQLFRQGEVFSMRSYWTVELEDGAPGRVTRVRDVESYDLAIEGLFGWSEDSSTLYFHGKHWPRDEYFALAYDVRSGALQRAAIEDACADCAWREPKRTQHEGQYAQLSPGGRWLLHGLTEKRGMERVLREVATGRERALGPKGTSTNREDWPVMYASVERDADEGQATARTRWHVMSLDDERVLATPADAGWPRDLDGARWFAESRDRQRVYILGPDGSLEHTLRASCHGALDGGVNR